MSTPYLTERELRELDVLEAKATKGKWNVLHLWDVPFVSAPPYEGHPYFGHTTTIEVFSDEDYPTKESDMQLTSASRNALPRLSATLKEAMDTLLALRNASHALLSCCELEVREAAGNTNVNCLLRRIEQADELLKAWKEQQ